MIAHDRLWRRASLLVAARLVLEEPAVEITDRFEVLLRGKVIERHRTLVTVLAGLLRAQHEGPEVLKNLLEEMRVARGFGKKDVTKARLLLDHGGLLRALETAHAVYVAQAKEQSVYSGTSRGSKGGEK